MIKYSAHNVIAEHIIYRFRVPLLMLCTCLVAISEPSIAQSSKMAFIKITNPCDDAMCIKVLKIENVLADSSVNYFGWDALYIPSVDTSIGCVTINTGDTNSYFFADYSTGGGLGASSITYCFYDGNSCLKDTICLTISFGPNSPPDSIYGTLSLVCNYEVNVSSSCPQVDSCNGFATASPLGGAPPYSYLWSSGQVTSSVSNLCSGSNFVTVVDSFGCYGQENFVLSGGDILLDSVTEESSPAACDGAIDISLIGGIPPYSYLWSTGDTSEDFSGLCTGNYSITVSESFGNCSLVESFTVGNVLKIRDYNLFSSSYNDLSRYVVPNPNIGKFRLDLQLLSKQYIRLNIYNQIGQNIYSSVFTHFDQTLSKEIDLSHVGSGIYLLVLVADNSVLKTNVVIK